MADISTLSLTFDVTPPGPTWNVWGDPAYVYVSGGELVLKSQPGGNNYNGFSSSDPHNWVGQSGSVGIGTLQPLVGGGDAEFAVTLLTAEIETENRYYWSYEGANRLACYKVLEDDYIWQGDVALGDIKRVRIRFSADGGTCYFDYTTDVYGLTGWTTLATVATTGVPATALYVDIASGNYGPISGTYTNTLTDFNSPPAVPANPNKTDLLAMFF